ncbi:MAG: type II toxin-antitoxin system PemK/MazF family toxin [Phycisphaerae bacterium]
MANPLQGEVYRWPDVPDKHPMSTKVRMWVVVSRDVFNKHFGYVLACPLTSYPPTQIDIPVRSTPHNPLTHDSALLARMVTPIGNDELGQPLGRLPFPTIAEVAQRLHQIIETGE